MQLFEDNAMDEYFNYKRDYSDSIPAKTPYLTFTEYCNLTGNPEGLTKIEYIHLYEADLLDDEGNVLEEVDITSEIRDLYEMGDYEALAELGWDPDVEPTDEAFEIARRRNTEWLNENIGINIIDSTDYDSPMYFNEITDKQREQNNKVTPIFVILQFRKNAIGLAEKIYNPKWEYGHAGMSFESSLSTIYTFLVHGMTTESINDYKKHNDKMKVLALFLSNKAKSKMTKAVKYYMDNKEHTKYSFANLGRLALKISRKENYNMDMICSEFVDYILKVGGVDISGKNSNMVAPEELGMYTDTANIYTVFEGYANDYDKEKVDNQIEKLKSTVKYDNLKAVKTKAERDANAAKRAEEEAIRAEQKANSKIGKAKTAIKTVASKVKTKFSKDKDDSEEESEE